MIRKIIKIDEEKCNGCSLCAEACHEGAISIVDGKAKLIRDDYCDGLGDCLPACPSGAITFEEREALAYNVEAVKAAQKSKTEAKLPCGCPGTQSRKIMKKERNEMSSSFEHDSNSYLSQWPVQIRLVPVNASYFNDAELLIAADCTAYACGDFHKRFIRNNTVLIGCPKLDDIDYSEKLSQIMSNNSIKKITVVKMEVPCCNGMVKAVSEAMTASKKIIPWSVYTVTTDGTILEQ